MSRLRVVAILCTTFLSINYEWQFIYIHRKSKMAAKGSKMNPIGHDIVLGT